MNHLPEIEVQSPDAVKRFQEEKLTATVRYLAQYSPFYQRLFSEHGVVAENITSLDDLATLPVTTKDDFQNHNWDFLCVARERIAEYTSTSGTLGSPVIVALTENDLQRLAYNESISFACADGSSADLYQLMLTLDRQFMAGIAYYQGIHKLGAGLIRVGPGLPAMQWETIQRLKPTVLVGVPSFLVKLIEYAEQNGIDLNQCSVKKAVCIGESLRTADLSLNALSQKIADAWNIKLYGTYASTEMQTAFTECGEGKGGHHHPELIIVEVLNDNNQPVKPGEVGEVTITTLGVEAMPLLRYKTGDMATAHTEACACGRTTLRLGPIVGRKQQMIKLKGTTLYPPGIFEILNQVPGVDDYAVEVVTGELGTDELNLHILTKPEQQPKTQEHLRAAFQSRLRVVPSIVFTTQPVLEKLQHAGRKIKKFIDSRKK
ncbi:phenylacetate--CoA ligase family protein [Chryseolinea lacunae]|uniref:AMP-binding protein n=1 Tax=Chryseolinea lacunae TaxID=2801331 RepID=A0ABS1KP97_9BACT|nr:AMP-binding protein [Chryseolinea lacunae]MBL0741295.1 AMP-binding protein [Chryseolinea lacunae]